MQFPKERKSYCPSCKKHTLQKIKQEKNRGKNKTNTMSKGSRARMKIRGRDRGVGNKGRLSKGAISGWKRWNKKRTKKTDLRCACADCRKTNIRGKGFRSSKILFA